MNTRDTFFKNLHGKPPGAVSGETRSEDELSSIHERLELLTYGHQDCSVDRFIARAKAAGSRVFHCANLAEAETLLVSHIGGGKRCVLARDPLLSRMTLANTLNASGCDLSFVTDAELAKTNAAARRMYASADIGITVALAGIADSGAIVISSTQNESRSVSLLPVEHVALLPAVRILPSLLQAAPLIRELQMVGGSSAVTLVGGPSKTADIEKVLVTGVHGPAVLTIVVIDAYY